ncbi:MULTISPECIES: copper resistance protein CopC [Staphylococcus]|uniref:copper resistance CopC/CopD family protein n=1 Tax=Staphylococcus TaxID=1279 RepID=UPI00069DCA7A|nr:MULTISPECIES: copper resistance protein CopC [Staphylococcus]MCI2944291.1 copper resistance protein CopC/CopD [Staphylococcus haemolyticus]MCI2946414.1 copper resistance protein CopC/CopD [Staphylococcus haemolyticus]PYE08787.1 copper transport protein [Staphylococcus sp. AtHG25]
MVNLQRSFKVALALIMMFLLLLIPILHNVASAHATLEKTTPTQNGVISKAPDTIELTFNEPVNAEYSGITIYNDKGNKVGDINPTTTGHSKTLTFPTDKVQQGTQQLEWHTVSADGHEISDRFEFSVGKKTANGVDTSPAFYEIPNFWFGLFRYIAEGATIILVGLYWLNGIARRNNLSTFDVFPRHIAVSLIMMMAYLMSLVLYLMTLSSDILDAILSLEPSAITQFPYILSAIALIVLSGLFVLRNMEKSWYWIVSIAMILAISMSGHAWSQSVPLWSIILRTLHLIGISLWLGALSYLLISVFTRKKDAVDLLREILLKVNAAAVAIIIISGVLMSIDQTKILSIWTNMQTWTVFLLFKVFGTLIMMLLGLLQTTRALNKRNRVNKSSLIIEVLIGILLILVGVIMSQISIP